MVSPYSTDPQVVAASQNMLQCTNTVREEDCKLVDLDVNNPAFKILKIDFTGKKTHLICSLDFKGYTQCFLLRNTKCKRNFFLFTRNLLEAPVNSVNTTMTAHTSPRMNCLYTGF